MKKLISLVTATTVLFFSACKKDPLDIPLGTFSVSIGGSKTTFNVQSKAVRSGTAGSYMLTIHGFKKDPASSSTDMKLIITSPNPITSGTFTENPSSGNTLVRIEHFQEFIFGLGTGYASYRSNSNPCTVTISSIAGASLKGTFKGDIQSGVAGAPGEKVVLSSGVFNVSF